MLGLGLLSGARHIESRDSILAKPWRTDARPAAGVAVFMVADIALVPTSNAWRRWLAAFSLGDRRHSCRDHKQLLHDIQDVVVCVTCNPVGGRRLAEALVRYCAEKD